MHCPVGPGPIGKPGGHTAFSVPDVVIGHVGPLAGRSLVGHIACAG